jgi:hypothetical protein
MQYISSLQQIELMGRYRMQPYINHESALQWNSSPMSFISYNSSTSTLRGIIS